VWLRWDIRQSQPCWLAGLFGLHRAGDQYNHTEVQAGYGHWPLPSTGSSPADDSHHPWTPGPYWRSHIPLQQQVWQRRRELSAAGVSMPKGNCDVLHMRCRIWACAAAVAACEAAEHFLCCVMAQDARGLQPARYVVLPQMQRS